MLRPRRLILHAANFEVLLCLVEGMLCGNAFGFRYAVRMRIGQEVNMVIEIVIMEILMRIS